MSEFANNESAFDALLESIKQVSNNIKRDAGTRFETLIKDWLTQDPSYCDLFSKVETFEEWTSSHPDLKQSGKDIGIDLVATLEDDPEAFAAIQCKFYDKDAVIPKSGVDSFIAASNRDYFKQRYIITTNENWSANALAEMQNVTPPIQLVGRSMLASSQIDWSVYLKTGKVVQKKKRTPRKYQEEAIQRVLEGFKTNSRGKLIMACGTGKTFTSMKIAEKMEGNNGFVMFLVPSLALLSQTLTDWKRQCAVPIHAFAVCSDTTTGKADLKNVDEITSASDLCYPATTKADRLAEEVRKARSKTGMTVIFSTYQSIEVVNEAQHKFGMEEIGLIICDEAHRTAGGHYQDESDAPFQRIHSDDFIKGTKRLYMTATPRIYGDVVKEQKNNGEVVLYSMDDEQIYGPTFHTITFSQAVALGSLVDYKVIVLSVEENILKERALSDYELVQFGGLPVKHAAKVIGCWRALSKLDLRDEVSMSDDRQAMRRAVGFAQIIEPNMKYLDRTSSKRFTENFESTIEEFKDQQFKELAKRDKNLSREAYDLTYPLKCETRHIDGSMNATEKDSLLNWLREEPKENVCKILFNVRCLSEGVDVPSLDAVLFLSPRKSQVEVVQTVGRVMRVSPQTGKKRGYVIIPIVTPAGLDPSVALNNNADFNVVWQVLNALKSIDTEFGAIVDGQRNIIDSSKIEVVCITNQKLNKKTKKDPRKISTNGSKGRNSDGEQGVLDFNHDEILEQEIRARIVKRVGNRREWGDWAEDVGKICQLQITHINDVLKDPTKTKSRVAFESFKKELKATLNDSLTDGEIVEMLGQHVVTQPILDALFTIQTSEGTTYEFSKQNPIAIAMTSMMNSLDKESMKMATQSLEDFYRSVRNRTRTIKTSADRQLLIKELFEKFFKAAFPKQQEKLGIVYTPMNVIVPDAHGDWFNQRDDSYSRLMRMDGKKTEEKAIFKNFSLGVGTNRDVWAYASSKSSIEDKLRKCIKFYNQEVEKKKQDSNYIFSKDLTKISWIHPQRIGFEKLIKSNLFDKNKIHPAAYRPYIRQYLYFDRFWNNRVYQMPSIFPMNTTDNLVICSSGVGAKEYSCLMVDRIPCLDFLEKTQCFPRWLPGEQPKTAVGELFGDQNQMPSGFSPEALPHFQAAYPDQSITEDDLFYYIYGILHSEDYRTRYANNLMKELPRIPRVATHEQFMAFVEAGQELARLHVHFEDVTPYAGVTVEYTKPGQPSFRVKQMKWGKIKGKTGNAAKDKSTLIYNDWITVKNIPLEAQEYVVNKKSALDWVVERACVSIDKASGIVNDFNDYAAEMGNERYPLDLFLKIITVSLETMKIVKALPKLEIHPLDR